jgi:hypothetical protein
MNYAAPEACCGDKVFEQIPKWREYQLLLGVPVDAEAISKLPALSQTCLLYLLFGPATLFRRFRMLRGDREANIVVLSPEFST